MVLAASNLSYLFTAMMYISVISNIGHNAIRCRLLFSSKITFMFGELSIQEMDLLLKNEIVGRLGCHADGETYILPISYVYDGSDIYCHTSEGKKIYIMRKNPRVCFQVDNMKDMADWKSVIIQGVYEEITSLEEKENAIRKLLGRNLPLVSSYTTHLGDYWPFPSSDLSTLRGITFKISIKEKTGRFETEEESPNLPG
jgi:uncharacterized protein